VFALVAAAWPIPLTAQTSQTILFAEHSAGLPMIAPAPDRDADLHDAMEQHLFGLSGPHHAPNSCVSGSPPGLRLSRTSSFRRSQFWALVSDAECRHDLPRGLLDALVVAESMYDPRATSRMGAGGLAQLMPGTARELGVADRYDPASNIDAGARYLRQQLDRFGTIALALAAYNAGPAAVERSGGIPRNSETPAYVRRVLGLFDELQAVEPEQPGAARRLAIRLGFLD